MADPVGIPGHSPEDLQKPSVVFDVLVDCLAPIAARSHMLQGTAEIRSSLMTGVANG